MATQYTGSPTATQAPSPAPSLGEDGEGDPIGNLPADGDTLNASSVLQAFKVALDWIAFLRRQPTVVDASALVTSEDGDVFGATITTLGAERRLRFSVELTSDVTSMTIDLTGAAATINQDIILQSAVHSVLASATSEVVEVAGGSDVLTVSALAVGLGHTVTVYVEVIGTDT